MNNTKEILEQLETPVDVKRLIDRLPFDLDNLEQANVENPRLFLEAARYQTWAVLEKGRADVKLETKEAELYVDFKDRKVEKQTDKELVAKVASAPDVIKLKQRVYLAKASEVWAKQLVEAYNHRQQVLNNITKIRTAEVSNALRAVKEKAAMSTVRQEAERMRRRYDQEQE